MVLTEIEHDGIVGYGEASMPPYLGESHDTAAAFLSKVDLGPLREPVRARVDPRGGRRPGARQPGREGLRGHRPARPRRQAHEAALAQHLGLRPDAGAGDDVHDRHRHAGRREAEDARGRRVQGAEDQARAGTPTRPWSRRSAR
ncbi:MAG: hypothetical protein MZV64_28065 [Ignavibacteriales bacterium]|nr:hypothetical protein [Ignavibacteriales bacterium]